MQASAEALHRLGIQIIVATLENSERVYTCSRSQDFTTCTCSKIVTPQAQRCEHAGPLKYKYKFCGCLFIEPLIPYIKLGFAICSSKKVTSMNPHAGAAPSNHRFFFLRGS
jgi:hypothetical protein